MVLFGQVRPFNWTVRAGEYFSAGFFNVVPFFAFSRMSGGEKPSHSGEMLWPDGRRTQDRSAFRRIHSNFKGTGRRGSAKAF
jgi:hypothetical protein